MYIHVWNAWKIIEVCSLGVLKKSSNYGFANATDLTRCGERPGADRKELAVGNPNSARVSSEDDEWVFRNNVEKSIAGDSGGLLKFKIRTYFEFWRTNYLIKKITKLLVWLIFILRYYSTINFRSTKSNILKYNLQIW